MEYSTDLSVQLYCGDSALLLPQLFADSVDLIFTSPPYADSRADTYGGIKPDKYVDWFLPISEQLKRVIKPSGTFLSSQEEAIFGEFLEQLSVFVNKQTYGGKKSAAKGIDLEFSLDDIEYIVAIKSGPNWANKSQIDKMTDDFKSAKKTIRTNNRTANVIAVNGCCYGVDHLPDKGEYFEYCGQQFWQFISGNEELYVQIIEPLGYKAKEMNDDFNQQYAKMVNIFTQEFSDAFCAGGCIDWHKLLVFNSGRK